MKRVELIALLKRVSPGLSTKDLIPVLTCFCFYGDEKRLVTYDDIVAVQVPCDLPLEGGIRGQVLLDFLNASRAEDVVFENKSAHEITVKLARAQLDLTLLPKEEFVFEQPSRAGSLAMAVDETLTKALDICAVTMGNDPAHPWRLGITMVFGEGNITLYSTDNFTATRAVVDYDVPPDFVGKELILPPRFCSLLIESREKPSELFITQEWVEMEFEGGLRIFSRTVEGVDVESYTRVFDKVATPTAEIPALLDRCLDRALVVASNPQDRKTTFEVGKLGVNLDTKTSIGQMKDFIKLSNHTPIKVISAPDLLKRCLVGMKLIGFTNTCVSLKSDNAARLVRVFAEGD